MRPRWTHARHGVLAWKAGQLEQRQDGVWLIILQDLNFSLPMPFFLSPYFSFLISPFLVTFSSSVPLDLACPLTLILRLCRDSRSSPLSLSLVSAPSSFT